jgi:V/A-type H+/Na+-transporting ATPase subunit D
VPEIKLTKNELRAQQNRLGQLQKYLPTLQLKKALLQLEVTEARIEIIKLEEQYQKVLHTSDEYASLLTNQEDFNFEHAAKISQISRRYENIAGVEVPIFEGIRFEDFSYNLFETPAWVDSVVKGLRSLAEIRARTLVSREKKAALEAELRQVSIRVNLFEKILIPRALKNIKKIKVFLGDQLLAAVSQAKVAKTKIEEVKKMIRKQNLAKKEALNAR